MASGSSTLHIIDDDDDDDEFDWAAAVQEIDVACQATAAAKPSTSNFESNFRCNSGGVTNTVQEMVKRGNLGANRSSASTTKQSTLDRFIGVSSSGWKKSFGKAEVSNGEHGNCSNGNVIGDDNNGGDGSGYEDIDPINGVIKIDPEAAKSWIYPANVPRRDYQFSITRSALFSNTLVVLPTGLGKTLIAAAVMYNFFRWFPEGKIVFAAPSRPLVMQQIEACHNIVGIPQEWTIDLTGQTSPARRAEFWISKRVFFVTPQVLEKDIHSGSCMVRHLVCLVIDEAHRAMGNYSYCVAVRQLIETPVQLRILALTATPGSKQQTIQQVIDNLQISTLEYRNESDPDVLPYVHERKIELKEVPMGKNAVEINNLLLEVARPFVSRLSTYGVLQNRDFQTLSPCDLLNSRDKFRQEPPVALPHTRYGEIEGYFGALITLYHVRKLLSSHGIGPAYEMLEEKLKQGSFARLMSRNEVLLKAKLQMQQTVSHGAPSPKLAKMLEVLIDHFKVKDPRTSRVIIFSNFRGSVRDILNALTNIGDVVKATEFIGQSSGKTLKGQSQKVQQAVLQKFRTGGYNVIVATSIGEEGLDIMEVDLVICFDANVSPLRMIQRMGRTGRKHDGRVVVLACEGTELKGYMRKKANSKAIKKHLMNNGMNSFTFHSSPRMVPHAFKPEVQFLEMSIEEFVPRGKKVKDEDSISIPAYKISLTDAETDLLAMYFPYGKIDWRPSLIAFPHFQAFPSPINKVIHSSRTGMLIDMMQSLQGLPFSNDNKSLLSAEEANLLNDCLEVDAEKFHDLEIGDRSDDPAGVNGETEVPETRIEVKIANEMHTEDFHNQEPGLHTFLFGSEFVSVDDAGNVLVLSLPKLPLQFNTHVEISVAPPLYHSIDDSEDRKEKNFLANENMLELSPCSQGSQRGKESSADEILHTPVSCRRPKEITICDEILHAMHDEPETPLPDEPTDLSPRLTNFIKSGIVPESPVHYSGKLNGDTGNIAYSAVVSSQNLQTESFGCWTDDVKAISPVQDCTLMKMDAPCLSNKNAQPPSPLCKDNALGACASPLPNAKEIQTPLVKPTKTDSSKDWLFDSGVMPETIEQQCKLKRLRKHGEFNRKNSPELKEQNCLHRKLRKSRGTHHDTTTKLVKGEKYKDKNVAVYIEEEAEVSSEVAASDDEEDGNEGSSYEDSFIDDGVNTTSAATQAGAGGTDMMAIYRRSLLTQSPFQRLPNFTENFSPNSVDQSSRMDGNSGSIPSGTQHVQTPQTGLESTARNSQPRRPGIPTVAVESKLESRKRKLNYFQAQSLNHYQASSVPVVNLDQMFSLLHEDPGRNSPVRAPMETIEENQDPFEDDAFYEGIDLDAVEEEATKRLGYKSQKTATVALPEPVKHDPGFLDAPSFDLGF